MPDSADGFYEWMQLGKAKQPYCFEINEGELFAFAGILGSVEGSKRRVGQVLFDSDNDSKRRDLDRSLPDACDS